MADSRLTRRRFVRTGAVAAAGMAGGVFAGSTVHAGNPTEKKTDGILNYNEQMEYRRGGKTNLMFSAVCLGGHWKRVNKVVPNLFKGRGWLSADLTNPVITAPISGIITPEQVDTVATAVLQRRALDVKEQAELDVATDRAYANLPYHYRWLNDWNEV